MNWRFSMRPLNGDSFPIVVLLSVAMLSSAAMGRAQDAPLIKIDEYITRFAYSSGGRIAFSTQHIFSMKKIQLQRDDIWISEPDGKRHRIFQGEKFARGTTPFSYTVRRIRWSPDGTKLSVELGTSEMINDDGDTREGVATLLLDDAGSEIKVAGADSVIPGATDAAWLADGGSLVYLTERPQPTTLAKASQTKDSAASVPVKSFTVHLDKPATGATNSLFMGHTYLAAAWNAKGSSGIALESSAGGPTNLVMLDMLHETSKPLASLASYAGGLSLSPSGKKAAYWLDNERLEVRDLDNPNRLARVQIGLGTLAWASDESKVLVRRGPVGRSADLVWVALAPMVAVAAGSLPSVAAVVPAPILHGLEFRLFEVAPNGKSVAVVEPGRRNLLVYPLL